MEIHHDSENHKFYANVEGGEAHLLYRHGENDALDLYATEIPAQARGKNIADLLVREAIKQAKQADVQIVDTCPYVKSWFAKHPEESSILAYPPERAMHLI